MQYRWPEKMLVCKEETKVQAQERQKKEQSATKELRTIQSKLSQLQGILEGMSKKMESTSQLTISALSKYFDDLEQKKCTKASSLLATIEDLSASFLDQDYEERFLEELSNMRSNARCTLTEISEIKSKLYDLLEEKKKKREEEAERKAAASEREQENIDEQNVVLGLEDLLAFSLDNLGEKDCEFKARVIRAKANENKEEATKISVIPGRAQNDTLTSRLQVIKNHYSIAHRLLQRMNEISKRFKTSLFIQDAKTETDRCAKCCKHLLTEYEAKIRKRLNRAIKENNAEGDIYAKRPAKSYRR
jgi:RNase P subunit RPR2